MANMENCYGEKHYLKIEINLGMLKRAIYEKDKCFFEAMLDRLSAGASTTGSKNWRCIRECQDMVRNTVTLLFEDNPGSHTETVITHSINRLLEKD